jgi:hypothetical protein
MSICIFCKHADVEFTTDEHPISESLAGPNDLVLPPGLVCDGCQSYFGSKVERHALDDPPFSVARTLIGVPTKKRRSPRLDLGTQGLALGSPTPGQFVYRPPPSGGVSISSEGVGMIRIPTDPKNPRLVARYLVRIGLALVAARSSENALSPQYDLARRFARYGPPGQGWWYVHAENGPAMVRWLRGEATEEDKSLFVGARPFATDEGAHLVSLRVAYAVLTAPLHANVTCAPPPSGVRLFTV